MDEPVPIDFAACFPLLMDPRLLSHGPAEVSDRLAPFPWQRRLYETMCAGRLPDAIDIPTGLGKTAVIAIWLIARASGAPVPRRLVYVVDRRAIVDQATEVADRIATRLSAREAAESDELGALRKGLGLGEADDPLPVSTLRGQHADDRRWNEDPSRPAIIVGTVDMIGSRLLFGGYGVSPKMRPVHAGLIAHDTLIVLDEAHLSGPFEALIKSVSKLFLHAAATPPPPLPPRARLLSLTATARTQDKEEKAVFGLDAEDEATPSVSRRLNAPKPLTIVTEATGALEDALAAAAWEAGAAAPRRVLVFCDKRASAVKVHAELEKRLKKEKRSETHLALMTGERRVRERDKLKNNCIYKRFLGDAPPAADKGSVFLVATSAGEVGVDFDADAMVCDLVAFERMVQRIGRVNRRGRETAAPITVIAIPVAKEKPEETAARAKRLAALESLPRGDDGAFDASVAGFRHLKAAAAADPTVAGTITAATTEEPFRPALTEALVEAWSLTGLATHPGRPKVIAPWLRGWVEEEPQTTLVWRRWLPWRTFDPEPNPREVEDYFEAAPVHLTETLEAPVYRVEETLKKLMTRWQKHEDDPKAAAAAPARRDDGLRTVCALLLDRDGTLQGHWTAPALAGIFEHPRRRERFAAALTGATLVLQADLGGLDGNGLLSDKPPEKPSAPTLGDETRWSDELGLRFRLDDGEKGAEAAVEAIPAATDGETDADPWRVRFVFETAPEDGGATRLVVEQRGERLVGGWRRSLAAKPQSLAEHQEMVRDAVVAILGRLAIEGEIVAAFARAALLHDVGKARDAWQNYIGAPREGRPYAKGAGNVRRVQTDEETGVTLVWQGLRPQILEGYRHEFGSLLKALDDEDLKSFAADLRDLALHMIASHHGYARPLIPPNLTPPPIYPLRGTPAELDLPERKLEDPAWEAAARFERLSRQWGPWGLAWWEAVFRSADWAASRRHDERAAKQGGAR